MAVKSKHPSPMYVRRCWRKFALGTYSIINALIGIEGRLYFLLRPCNVGGIAMRFGDQVVANNSYVRGGNIPADASKGDGLLCASNTTNPTTRQWYKPNGDPVGTTPPDHGTYQNDTDGGVLLYRMRDLDRDIAGVYYCIISDSSGTNHTLYAGLYTGRNGTTISGRANSELKSLICMVIDLIYYVHYQSN